MAKGAILYTRQPTGKIYSFVSKIVLPTFVLRVDRIDVVKDLHVGGWSRLTCPVGSIFCTEPAQTFAQLNPSFSFEQDLFKHRNINADQPLLCTEPAQTFAQHLLFTQPLNLYKC